MINITKESIAFEGLKSLIVERLKPLNPDKIILFRGNFFAKAKTAFASFGSYAYGTPNEDSDIDICVVEKDYKNKWEDKRKIREALKDILNPKRDEYEFYKNEYGSVYKDIEEKGILLWNS